MNKKVFIIDLKNLPTDDEIAESLRCLLNENNLWVINYKRKQLLKKRKEKIMKLNGYSSTF